MVDMAPVLGQKLARGVSTAEPQPKCATCGAAARSPRQGGLCARQAAGGPVRHHVLSSSFAVPLPAGRSSAALPAPQRTAAPQRRRCIVPVAATGAAGYSAAMSHEELAAKVAEKERELQTMFEPGKVQPRVRDCLHHACCFGLACFLLLWSMPSCCFGPCRSLHNQAASLALHLSILVHTRAPTPPL